MSLSSCPFCTLQVLSTELQRHANSHFEDEDEATDVQFAFDLPQHFPVENPMQAVSSDEDLRRLVSSESQVRVKREVKHGFMTLLKNCLEWESGVTILSGYVDHFQSIEFEDVGWGCGWRNIQMLASHLLAQREEAREVLFGGVGIVPDIPSLQRWLEVAWGKGFDAAGSHDFDQKIYGKRTWIGTTECAALFRSFGLRARIVDFCISNKPPKVIGPIDRYFNRPDTCDPGSSSSAELVSGHQQLVDWVWSYFSDNGRVSKSGCNRVVATEKAPLYFQHNGHSRTIVGIQLKRLPNGVQQSTLLILDPAHKTQVLESCLSKKVGWQRFIKRGVHTLKKTEYQLCYVDAGLATGAEMEKLKTLDSTRFDI